MCLQYKSLENTVVVVTSLQTTSKPFPKRQILDSSKHKEAADDNLKFDENGSKLSKRAENSVGKGEIARYKQFLLFPHLSFSKGLKKMLDRKGKTSICT